MRVVVVTGGSEASSPCPRLVEKMALAALKDEVRPY